MNFVKFFLKAQKIIKKLKSLKTNKKIFFKQSLIKLHNFSLFTKLTLKHF